jgi:hypothetical protein
MYTRDTPNLTRSSLGSLTRTRCHAVCLGDVEDGGGKDMEPLSSGDDILGDGPHEDTLDYLTLLVYQQEAGATMKREGELLIQPPELNYEEASSWPSRKSSWRT